jgi:hypothetical protein
VGSEMCIRDRPNREPRFPYDPSFLVLFRNKRG